MSDERLLAELALRSCDGDEVAFAALCRQLGGLLWKHVEALYIPGCEYDDLMQEARIGLLKATESWDARPFPPFISFASMCIRRQLLTALKMARARKHRPLNDALSLQHPQHGSEVGDTYTLEDTLGDPRDFRADLDVREELATIALACRYLSPLERRAVQMLANGESYEDAAADAGVTTKAIDNACQRAKRKLLPSGPARTMTA